VELLQELLSKLAENKSLCLYSFIYIFSQGEDLCSYLTRHLADFQLAAAAAVDLNSATLAACAVLATVVLFVTARTHAVETAVNKIYRHEVDGERHCSMQTGLSHAMYMFRRNNAVQ
jgi:hypothetical protein